MQKMPPDWMLEEHRRMKSLWEQEGKPSDFYTWLLNRVETRVQSLS